MRDIWTTFSEILAPACEETGCEIYDVEITKSGKDKLLRVYIDKEGGVDINTCESFSRLADPLLDAADPFDTPYIFEVSSPGVERAIKRDRHFEKAIGQKITLKLFQPVRESKTHIVTLLSYQNAELTVQFDDGATETIPKNAVAGAKIYYDFTKDFERKDNRE